MLNTLVTPDWDALDAYSRQTWIGRVHVGDWPYTFPLRNDNDRLFLDLLADCPVSDWSWFFDSQSGAPPTPDAFRLRVSGIFAHRNVKAVLSLTAIDWAALQVRVGATAKLISPPFWLHPQVTDAFAIYASVFPFASTQRPHHLAGPLISSPS